LVASAQHLRLVRDGEIGLPRGEQLQRRRRVGRRPDPHVDSLPLERAGRLRGVDRRVVGVREEVEHQVEATAATPARAPAARQEGRGEGKERKPHGPWPGNRLLVNAPGSLCASRCARIHAAKRRHRAGSCQPYDLPAGGSISARIFAASIPRRGSAKGTLRAAARLRVPRARPPTKLRITSPSRASASWFATSTYSAKVGTLSLSTGVALTPAGSRPVPTGAITALTCFEPSPRTGAGPRST